MNHLSSVFKQSTLVKNSIIYVTTDGISKAIPFIVLPLISHYLSPAEYGIITNFNVFVGILSALIYNCTGGIIPVMYYKLNKKELKHYVSNVLCFNTIAGVMFFLMIIIFSDFLEDKLIFGLKYQIIALIIVWFSALAYPVQLIWRCEEKAIWFGTYHIIHSLINAVLTICFVIFFLWGWKGRVYGILISIIISSSIAFYLLALKGYLTYNISKKYLKIVFIYSVPLLPHAIALWAKNGVDKILLTNYCSLAENGFYSVAVTWGVIVAMVVLAFSNAFNPYLYKKLSQFDKDRKYSIKEQLKLVKMIKLSICGLCVLVVFAYIISHLLTILLFPSSYYGALKYLPWIMLSQLFNGIYSIFAGFAYYTMHTKELGMITFSLTLIQLFLTYMFLILFGEMGVAYSSALGSFLICLVVSFYGIHTYKLPWIIKNSNR